LSKMATILRSKSGGLTVEDLQTFLARLR